MPKKRGRQLPDNDRQAGFMSSSGSGSRANLYDFIIQTSYDYNFDLSEAGFFH